MSASSVVLESMYRMGVIRDQDCMKSYTRMKGINVEMIREPIKYFNINDNKYRCILSFQTDIGVKVAEIIATENDIYCAVDSLEYYLDYDPGYAVFICGLNKETLKSVNICLRSEIDMFNNKTLFMDIFEYSESAESLCKLASFEMDFITDLPVFIDKLYETFLLDLQNTVSTK